MRLAAILFAVQSAPAVIVAPYVSDTSSLFLFHLDEAVGTSTAANSGTRGTNGYSVNATAGTAGAVDTGVLGAAAFAGFGSSAAFFNQRLIGWNNNSGTYDGETGGTPAGADKVTGSVLGMSGINTNSFTMECMINVTNAARNLQQNFISGEATSPRGMRFSLANTAAQIGVIEWNAAAYFAHHPTLQFSLVNKTNASLTFNSQIGWDYRVQTRTNLTAWFTLTTLNGIGGQLQYTHTNSVGATQRYWRLQSQEGGFGP